MQALPRIRAEIEKELAQFPRDYSGSFGDDTVIRLSREEELVRRLLALTDEYIAEQGRLEARLEAYI